MKSWPSHQEPKDFFFVSFVADVIAPVTVEHIISAKDFLRVVSQSKPIQALKGLQGCVPVSERRPTELSGFLLVLSRRSCDALSIPICVYLLCEGTITSSAPQT